MTYRERWNTLAKLRWRDLFMHMDACVDCVRLRPENRMCAVGESLHKEAVRANVDARDGSDRVSAARLAEDALRGKGAAGDGGDFTVQCGKGGLPDGRGGRVIILLPNGEEFACVEPDGGLWLLGRFFPRERLEKLR